MSELISGKEALIALANGEDVQGNIGSEWVDISVDQKLSIKSFITETNDYGVAVKFRLKPRTITINGVELNQCYSVAIDSTELKVSVVLRNKEDTCVLYNLLADLYSSK